MKYYMKDDGTTVESNSAGVQPQGFHEITKNEFALFITNLPAPTPATDWTAVYTAASTDSEKIIILAKMAGLQK